MSREELNEVLEEISRNAGDWQSDPKAFISRYSLSSEEEQGLTAGDESALRRMGVEERLVKSARVRF